MQAALADVGIAFDVVDRGRWDSLPEMLRDAELLVHATPIGTGSDESPVPADLLRPDLAVLDLVYRHCKSAGLLLAVPAAASVLTGDLPTEESARPPRVTPLELIEWLDKPRDRSV